VLFKKEHAWVGCWLVPTSFSTPTIEDSQAIRKRVQSGELMVFETTVLAQKAKGSLRAASELGNRHLTEEDEFRFGVDIKRARERRILPLPSRGDHVETRIAESGTGPLPIEVMPPLPPLDADALAGVDLIETPDTPAGRLARWKSKLLDLTLRNRLLNFKRTKSNIQLFVTEPAALEDLLGDGREFRFSPLPKIMDGADPRMSAVHVDRQGEQPLAVLAREALTRNELLAMVEGDKLDGRLLEIFNDAKLSLQEGGSNTLFLALGFLKWTEAERSEVTHLAPILLVPVTMRRQSVRSGFTLVRHDDDTIVNPTLLQLLREEYQLSLRALDPLPKDKEGVDVDRVWQIFRLAISDIPQWEVVEQIHLGIFSFTKYLMWKDLQDRTAALKQNRVVAHLMDHPGEAFGRDGSESVLRDLDDSHQPQDLFAPMLADSSQLRALCTAADGKDFVLEGPPGTGKSQTITNLISHFLAIGKTVLFVSEKMAALDVVHRRLAANKLGPFCLELHSAKAKKSDVLQQLGEALNFAGAQTAIDWEREANRLASLRLELNSLVRTLHRRHSNDLTVYDATGLAILHREWTPAEMPWADAEVHDRSALDALRETVRRISTLAAELSSLEAHPLGHIARTEWTPAWEDGLFQAVSSLDKSASLLEAAGAAIVKSCTLPESGQSLEEYASMDLLADVLLKAPGIPMGLAARASDPKAHAKVHQLRTHGVRRAEVWKTLAGSYDPGIATLQGAELLMAWNQAITTWWPKRWFAQRSIKARLAPFRADKRPPAASEVESLLPKLTEMNQEDKVLHALDGEAAVLLDSEFRGVDTDWAALEDHETWAKAFADATMRFGGGDLTAIDELRARLLPIVSENRAVLAPTGPIGRSLLRFRDAYRDFIAQLRAIELMVQCANSLCGERHDPAAFPRVRAVLQRWVRARRQIRIWCSWQAIRTQAIGQGLASVVTALEQGSIGIAQVVEYFEYSYQTWWFKRVIDRDPILRTFASVDHERKIREFREADARFQHLTRDCIVARLAGKIPNANIQTGPDSEIGRLRRELQRQRGLMPVRQLVQGLPTLLPKLKPCLLMSPLSVAQYLDAGHPSFDLVVFDEASQIPVWDAVGAIARGKQLLVVGDPKQLPPTNFFNRTDDPEEPAASDTEVKDLESILDECLGAGLRHETLDWHYRSRHESLIAFSNVTYYDSRLITFPSPVTRDTAVSFRPIVGTYDRGASRTNRAEAEAIVDEIAEHYADVHKREKTLGVVTFNQPQMQLIESLLDARRRSDPELDRQIAEKKDEELFIKNLENVQGDERDVILFSITYGPDKAGRVTMAFGPLNLEGGQRRLNVAISRARERVVIFSTLNPDQIDLARISAAGVIDLKNYLDFAIRGPKALVEQCAPTGIEPDSPFEVAVIRALRDKGWTVHPQVGCTGYRIDIGIVDPRAPGRYLLGIECDGRSYHSGATARDRDRLRQLVLERLGWKLQRIWSTDWWTDHDRELQKLNSILESMVQAPSAALQDPSTEKPAESIPFVDTAAQQPLFSSGVEAARPLATSPPVYSRAVITAGDPERFYQPGSSDTVSTQMLEVVNTEGPLSEEALFRKVARAWGLERTGARITARLRDLLPREVTFTDTEAKRFVWPKTVNPDEWSAFRVSDGSESSRRHIEELAPQEIANLAAFLLDQGGSTTQAELARSVCRQIGMVRVPADAQNRALQGIKRLVSRGGAVAEGDRIRPQQ
jgi:very-short-patch-repair endonuclease